MQYLIPHYRLVTEAQKETLMHSYNIGMLSCLSDYNFPLASWTEKDCFRMISQARTIMGWNLHFMNGNFYHVDWIPSKKTGE